MLAAHEWDRAEGASVVAAFTDLEVAHMRQSAGEHADARMHGRDVAVSDQAARFELGDQPIHLGRSEKEVDLGESVAELAFVPLHHAADADDRPAASVLLEATRLDKRVDGLLLGRVDEAARVD